MISSVNRDASGISADLVINGIPKNSCVGFDVWVDKEINPTFTAFGIYGDTDATGNSKTRLHINASGSCNQQMTIRSWYVTSTQRSGYGTAYSVPTCNGLVPIRTDNLAQGISYVTSAQSTLKSLAQERLVKSGLATSQTSNSNNSTSTTVNSNVPPQPTSPKLKVVDNRVQLVVNLGDGAQPVTRAYLIASDLGFDIQNLLIATIIKNQAVFDFPLTKTNSGVATTAEIYSANAYGTSQTLELPIFLPELQSTNTTVNTGAPASPKNIVFNLFPEKLVINVDLPTIGNIVAKGAYLIAPLIGFTKENPLRAVVNNGKAAFEMSLTQYILGKSSDMQIYSTNDSGDSEPLESFVSVPSLPGTTTNTANSGSTATNSSSSSTKTPVSAKKNSAAPPTPTDPKYKLLNGNVILTVNAPSAPGAIPSIAYLTAPGVGIDKNNPIIGKVSSGVATFAVAIQSEMAGKTTDVYVYTANDFGVSKPLSGRITIPKSLAGVKPSPIPQPTAGNAVKLDGTAAKVTTTSPPAAKPTATKKPTTTVVKPKVSSVVCLKGKLSRTFISTTCPTGWKKG